MKKMQVGQVVDFTISYNERAEAAERKRRHEAKYGVTRQATQADFDAFFG